MDSTSFSPDHVVAPGIDLDVVIIGDLRVADESAARTVHQTTIQAKNGYRTGLLHGQYVKNQAFPFINPEIDRLVRSGLATAIDPATPLVTTKLLLIESPVCLCKRLMEGVGIPLPRIVAQNAIVLLDDAVPLNRISKYHSLISALFGSNITWAATTPEARACLAMSGVPSEGQIWRVSVSLDGSPLPARSRRQSVVIGRTTTAAGDEWPADPAELATAYPSGNGRIMRVLALPWIGKSNFDPPEDWIVTTLRNSTSAAFLRNLDFFVYFPGDLDISIPAHAMAWAMAHGVPVIADRRLQQRLGKGPIYAEPAEVAELTNQRDSKYDALVERCVQFAKDKYGPKVHIDRLATLIGPPRRTLYVAGKKSKKRILFTCTNGIGIGHVTRLLAVARRLPEDYAPVFAILSPAAHLVRLAGYPVEYIPSARTALCDQSIWNKWLQDELLRIMDFHDIQGLMFDGGQPFQGVISAMRARPDVKSVWMRRALWRKEQVNDANIARQHFFDLVMEPGDIAESADMGATVENQDMTMRVDPIHLLDEDELLDRAEAAERIGLDPDRPACLIQLGAGANRDLLSLMDGSIRALRAVDGLQIVVARWPIATHDMDFWPETICLRGYPISKYYRAFDFTISATGYNSFHEIVTFALPAIFLANSHMVLDDQVARAEFAQSNDAGFHLPESRVDAIGSIIQSIMDEQTRSVIRSNCHRLARENGAGNAAAAFAELVG